MLRGNIGATSRNILWKYLYSVKCYDKSNMNVFTISVWANLRGGGLNLFCQFIWARP